MMTTDETIASLTGRIVMLEALLTNTLGRLVVQYDKPIEVLATVMDATEASLLSAKSGATGGDIAIADAALGSYRHTSAHLLQMVNFLAEPRGRA